MNTGSSRELSRRDLGAEVAKGFYFRKFEDAFRRYLSPDTPSPPASNRYPVTALEEQGETTVFESVTDSDGNAFKKPENPSNSVAGNAVTLSEGGSTGVEKKTLPPDTIII